MISLLRRTFLRAYACSYMMARPLIFRRSAQQAHDDVLTLLERLDRSDIAQRIIRTIGQVAFVRHRVEVGGVVLPHPFILAAGFVKGKGFNSESAALEAVQRGKNIIPGWRTMPRLTSLVEFGSYTRWPRMGNRGTVIWRDPGTNSTQNRVGLKNPGATAAAAFFAQHIDQLPAKYGINIAVSPGVSDPVQEKQEALESLQAFLGRGIYPTWFTLNLSCPNTEDDPTSHQTEYATRELCSAIVNYLHSVSDAAGREIPLWVKISPTLHDSQYRVLMRIFHETGVRAVIASNTIARSAPDDSGTEAGVGGGKLHPYAVGAAQILAGERDSHRYAVDVIGCGGVQNSTTYRAFAQHKVSVVQYYSAMIYRGPLAAALLLNDIVKS